MDQPDLRGIHRAALDTLLADPTAASDSQAAPQKAKANGKARATWRDNLIFSRNGKPKGILANAIEALRHAPEWTGVLAFNEFSLGTLALKPPPWPGAKSGAEWTDHEDRLTANWLQHAGILVGVEIAGQSVQAVARDRCFHPVREYLDSLKWDGAHRLDQWLNGISEWSRRPMRWPLAHVG
jgi:predicted P-loop ATPase